MDTVFVIIKLITSVPGSRAGEVFLAILAGVLIIASVLPITLIVQKLRLALLEFEALLNFGGRSKERRKPVSGLQFS